MLRLPLLGCAFVCILAAHAASASAQDTAAPAATTADACAELPAGEAHARTLALQDELDPQVLTAALWWWAWLAGYATVAVAQTIIALAVEDPGWRWPSVVGAVSSALGVGSMLISPVTTHRLSARFRELGPLTGTERLRAVEHEVASAAEGEDDARNFLSHALGWGAAVGGGLVLWLGFDQLLQGVLNVVESVVVSEVQIALTPTSARDAWHAYVALHPDAVTCLRDQDESSARAPLPGPALAIMPVGLGAGLVFTF